MLAGVALPPVLLLSTLGIAAAAYTTAHAAPLLAGLSLAALLVFPVAIGAAALAVIPSLALRPGWLWWPASLVGPFIGLVGGFLLLQGVFRVKIFCWAMSGAGAQLCAQTYPHGFPWDWLELVAPLAVMGLLQAVTVSGLARKLGWAVTSVIGAFVYVYGLAGGAFVFGSGPQMPGWTAAFVAGAAWGLVVGVGLAFLTSRRGGSQAAVG